MNLKRKFPPKDNAQSGVRRDASTPVRTTGPLFDLPPGLCQLVEAEEERLQERASLEGVGRILGDFGDVASPNESRREL
jgi:hypothetical protein